MTNTRIAQPDNTLCVRRAGLRLIDSQAFKLPIQQAKEHPCKKSASHKTQETCDLQT